MTAEPSQYLYQPLEANAILRIDDSVPTREKFWNLIPVLGWTIAGEMWRERTLPIVEHIDSQLETRPKPPPTVWGEDKQRIQMGLYLSKLAKKEIGWCNDHFIPADPAFVVFWSHEDGLDFESVICDLEENSSMEITEEEAMTWFDKTLGDVVDILLLKLKRLYTETQGEVWPPPPTVPGPNF